MFDTSNKLVEPTRTNVAKFGAFNVFGPHSCNSLAIVLKSETISKPLKKFQNMGAIFYNLINNS